jgi:hypothetical protein
MITMINNNNNKVDVVMPSPRAPRPTPTHGVGPQHLQQPAPPPACPLSRPTPPPQYSFAMICFQLFEGLPPFYNIDPIEAARGAALKGLRPTWGTVNRRNQVGGTWHVTWPDGRTGGRPSSGAFPQGPSVASPGEALSKRKRACVRRGAPVRRRCPCG